MQHIKDNPRVDILLAKTDEFLGNIGFTEHGKRHAALVSHIAHNILNKLDFSEREQKLAEIAGYLHDVGNAINRKNHAQTGALIVFDILKDMHFDMNDLMDICGAIGNHHEEEGKPVSFIAAALIIADKSDVHRTRVRGDADIKLDIHDRVNWAVQKSYIHADKDKKTITLNLSIDTHIAPVIEYFEIFMERMLMCRKAADFLGCRFNLYINDEKLL